LNRHRRLQPSGLALIGSERVGPWPGDVPAAAAYGTASLDRAKQSFLAAMSHELRTPLNAIIGFAEIMDGQVLGPVSVPQYRQYIRDILESGHHLLRIIESVLDISSAEAGELVLGKREVDLGELVADAQRDTEMLRTVRSITLEMNVADDLVVRVDPEKIRRAIACLISNAVKFSDDGTIVRVNARVDQGHRVTVEVRDQGIGIDPLAIDRVFLPFVQLEDRLCRRFDGSGLGLPLARLFAELHGGKVELASIPGKGTTATLIFPAYGEAPPPDEPG
jgi:signal transduction histidine kinase